MDKFYAMKSFNVDEFKWVVEHLDHSNDATDWKQSLSTLAFISTEQYGQGVKEALLIPYLKKAVEHTETKIQKIGIRFIISFKTFDLLTEVDRNVLAETFYEKFIKSDNVAVLKPLKITFQTLQKEGKLQKFLEQIGQGKFSKDIIKEITTQLWYRNTRKNEEALDVIEVLLNKLDIEKEDFVPFIHDFVKDLDNRIYLKGQDKLKTFLKQKALGCIGSAS